MNKPALTSVPIHPLLSERWSPCSFDADKPVSDAAQTAMLEAARWAPSCYGAQPWNIVVCNKRTHPDAWQKLLSCLAAANQEWAKHAPLLLLICGDTLYAHNGKDNRHHAYDSGAAAVCLALEAENQGLRAHQMGGFDADAAGAAFNVPAQNICMAVVAVGAQMPAESMSEGKLRARDETPRQRKPLSENFFFGDWGKNSGA